MVKINFTCHSTVHSDNRQDVITITGHIVDEYIDNIKDAMTYFDSVYGNYDCTSITVKVINK